MYSKISGAASNSYGSPEDREAEASAPVGAYGAPDDREAEGSYGAPLSSYSDADYDY